MSSTEPVSGLEYGWDPNTENFAAGMDANLLKIGRALGQLSVIDRDLTSPPGSPAAGDRYIVGPGASGDWTGRDDEVAVWDGAAWVFYPPSVGWQAYIEDEEVLAIYKSTGWSAGLAI